MVISRLWGGLGNQLFQYAAGYALARSRGTKLLLDPTQCRLDANRPYELDHLNVTGKIWSEPERKWIERLIRVFRPPEQTTRGWAQVLKRRMAPGLSRFFSYVGDRHAGYQSEITAQRGHIYLAGTWADEKYFRDYAEEIRHEFRFKSTPDDENQRALDQIQTTRSVCVHVRRGDYVQIADTRERFGTCSLDYYQEAVHHIVESATGCTAFVFSDDPAWTAEHLQLPCPTVHVIHNVGKRNYEDLRLMAACQHFVIANSTFSWWGAWLSEQAGKTVVAPKRWSVVTQGIGDPVLPTWVRL